MAKKKKALERFVDALPGSSLPSEGCEEYRLAMSDLRMFVAENCPYVTKVEVYSYNGFELSLSTSVSYRTSCGILIQDGEIHTPIDPEGSVKDLMGEIMGHAKKVEGVQAQSYRNTNNLREKAF